MLVSKTKFLQYQSMFYKKLLKTPYKIQLEIITVQKIEPTGEFSIISSTISRFFISDKMPARYVLLTTPELWYFKN